jgi:hypothetical protein
MPSLKISDLPAKVLPASSDIIPIIDTQFGAGSFVSKRMTIGALIDFARTQFVSSADFSNFVVSVNGKTGTIALTISDLVGVALTNPAAGDLLVYDGAQQRWANKSVADEIIDLGAF